MPSLNVVHIMGNLTRDPEVQYTPKGTAVCKISVAINSSYKNDAGEKVEKTTFADVDCWGRTAELIGEHFKKGSPIFIAGRLETQEWQDKKTGDKRSKLAIVAETFQFIGGRDEPRQKPAEKRSSSPPLDTYAQPPKKPVFRAPPTPEPDLDGETDSIPF